MLNVSEAFNEACLGDDRNIKFRLFVPSSTEFRGGFFSSDSSEDENLLGLIKDLTITESMENSNGLSMGSVNSTQLDINVYSLSAELSVTSAKHMVGMQLICTVANEECNLGLFYCTSFESKDNFKTITIKAFDFWTAYSSTIFDVQTIDFSNTVYASEIANRLSYSNNVVDQTGLTNIEINAINNNTTEKELLGYLGSLRLGNVRVTDITNGVATWGYHYYDTSSPVVVIDQDYSYIDEVEIKTYEDVKVNSLTVTNQTTTMSAGSDKFYNVSFSNPWYTESLFNSAYSQINGMSFRPLQVRWVGNPAVQCGDTVLVEGDNGATYNALVMSQKTYYDGGLSTTIYCYGTSATEGSIVKSPTEKKINELQGSVQNVQADVNGHSVEINSLSTTSASLSSDMVAVKTVTNQVTNYFDFGHPEGLKISSSSRDVGTIYGSGSIKMVDANDNVLSEYTSNSFDIRNLKYFRIGRLIISAQSNGSVSFIGASNNDNG